MTSARLHRESIEVLIQSPGFARLHRESIEVLLKTVGFGRLHRESIEVLLKTVGSGRLHRESLEVLMPYPEPFGFRWGPSMGIAPLLIQHSFTAANTTTIPAGEAGPAPVAYNGVWSINSNQLLAPGSGEAVIGWETGQTSYTMEFVISSPSVDPGPCVRLQDGANYILCQMNFTGTSAIYQRVGGNYGGLISAVSVPWASGDLIRVVNTPSTVDCYRNGTLVMTANTAQFANQTKIGFRTNGGANRFDNLLVTGPVT